MHTMVRGIGGAINGIAQGAPDPIFWFPYNGLS